MKSLMFSFDQSMRTGRKVMQVQLHLTFKRRKSRNVLGFIDVINLELYKFKITNKIRIENFSFI